VDDFADMEELPEAEAAVIVAGMRLVARADGDVHENELAMIEELGQGLPMADPNTLLSSEATKTLYIRSLGMLALADGVMSAPEVSLIREIADHQGLSHEQVDGALRSVKLSFFKNFAGVSVFADQAREIGLGLGLDSADIDDILTS
jgi:uncharacterized tellurite resistance protein B-like protein